MVVSKIWCKLFMIQTIRNAFFKSMAMTRYITNEDQKEMVPEEVCVKCVSHCHVRVFATPWTVARQVPLSMEFPRQQYWSGLPFPSPGDLPNPGIEPESPALQADSLLPELPEKPNGTCTQIPKIQSGHVLKLGSVNIKSLYN